MSCSRYSSPQVPHTSAGTDRKTIVAPPRSTVIVIRAGPVSPCLQMTHFKFFPPIDQSLTAHFVNTPSRFSNTFPATVHAESSAASMPSGNGPSGSAAIDVAAAGSDV